MALEFFRIVQRFLSAEEKGMGILGLKVLYSSSGDLFLVTKTWMTLSPSESPTCSG